MNAESVGIWGGGGLRSIRPKSPYPTLPRQGATQVGVPHSLPDANATRGPHICSISAPIIVLRMSEGYLAYVLEGHTVRNTN